MKHGAITFAFLLAAGAAGGAAFTGCSSEPENTVVNTDSGIDTAPVDTGRPPPDTNPPPPPPSCHQPLPGDFACVPPPSKPGKTVCTDEAINSLMAGCFGDAATQATCSAARSKYKACDTCFLTDWIYGDFGFFFDTGACIKKIDPASTCATTVSCNVDCIAAVCSECDDTAGTGKTATTSEQDNCLADVQWKGSATRPKGVCYDKATKDYAACAGNERFKPCFARSIDDITAFVRGACRDNGNWDKAYEELPKSDAGTDGSTDSALSDTGLDTGTVVDSAVDVAVDAAVDAVDALGD